MDDSEASQELIGQFGIGFLAAFLLHEGNLVGVVQEYADFLPTPIYVQGADSPANLGVTKPDWDDSKLPERLEAFEAIVEAHYLSAGASDMAICNPNGSQTIRHRLRLSRLIEGKTTDSKKARLSV